MNEPDELLEDALEMTNALNFPRTLTLSEYQRWASETTIFPKHPKILGLYYLALGLGGEAGEIQNKIKKILRDNNGVMSEEQMADLLEECGDLMWYLANLIKFLYGDMGEVGADNITKLRDRQKRGVLGGSGDHR